MKIKSYLLATVFAITFFSCSKDNEIANESNTATEKQVLSFNSEKEMQAKIAEIETFKKNQEMQILEKLLKRNNLKAPTAEDVKNIGKLNSNVAIDKKAILEDVKFYHQEKLKAIYAERAHFGFTSIQSIADEINFTKLIKPKLSQELASENKDFLFEFNYQYHSVYDNISLVIEPKSNTFISEKELDLNKHKISIKKTNQSNQSNKVMNEGVVCSNYNNFFMITFHCVVGNTSLQYDLNGNVWYQTGFLNRLGCFVFSSVGYVLYPCYYFTNSTSIANYLVYYPSNAGYSLIFPSGIGSTIDVMSSNQTNSIPNYIGVSGNVGGSFAVPIAGTSSFLWASGTRNF